MAPEIRRSIRFLLNGEPVELTDVAPGAMLLDYLRLEKGLRGAKEGCAEGDCGACTVLVGRLRQGEVIYESVSSCIRFVASLDGCHVVSVEALKGPEGALHPVQRAMVDNHGSQCGFCTPGIVMSLYGLILKTPKPGEGDIERALQGNMCRCTGYAPIIRAGLAISDITDEPDPLIAGKNAVGARLGAMRDGKRVETGTGKSRVILPADADDLAQVFTAEPDATLIAGATDAGLWVTKEMRDIGPLVFIGHLEELRTIKEGAGAVTFGAGVSYDEAAPVITARFPQMTAYWDRIGNAQVRHMGTIGGNIANGSPIGDMPPPLMVLDATLTLRKGSSRRTIALEDFFVAYDKRDRAPGEFVESISVPCVPGGEIFAAYKLSKRRDEDISTLTAAFRVGFDHAGRVNLARAAFGGMAAIPKRAKTVEAALLGQMWDEAAIENAATAMAEDFTPISDIRGTAEYRLLAAQNLVRRFYLESTGADVRLRRDVK